MQSRPNLFVVGAPKCGTTALTRYLEAHPQVFMAERKDLHYFGTDLDLRLKQRDSEAAYLARFAPGAQARWRGDSSVWYLYSTRAAAEIAAYAPDARVLALLRDPVDAMYAHWAQLRLNGLGDEDLNDFALAVAAEEDRAAGRRIPAKNPMPSALLYGRVVSFADQVARYQAAFPAAQLRVLLQEDMKADTAGVLEALFRWLEVDPQVKADTRPVNTAKVVRSESLRALIALVPGSFKDALPPGLRQGIRKRVRALNSRHQRRDPLDPALRRRLQDRLRPDVRRLETLLDRPLLAPDGPWFKA